jgi:hypothetical protein
LIFIAIFIPCLIGSILVLKSTSVNLIEDM